MRRRTRFLELVGEGAAVSAAAKIVGVCPDTVYRWIKLGRQEEARDEHRQFAEDFDRVEASCTHEAVKLLDSHARGESPMAVKATLALLQARDARFGDRRLKHLQARTELERSKVDLEIAKLKLEAARAALEAGGSVALILGLEALLDAPGLSPQVREELRAVIASGKVASLEARDLG